MTTESVSLRNADIAIAAAANDSSTAITAQSGSNLALSFTSLSPEKQCAMSSFYAFCRLVDDVADSTTLSVEDKRAQLEEWRSEIHRAYLGGARTAIGRELGQIGKQYLVPPQHLEEIVDGVMMDLTATRYETFADLYKYCYHVASAVGLVSIEIFGYRDLMTRRYAVDLGMAFQLTNILRDVKKDAGFGRIYLPQEEMREWGVTDDDIIHGRWSPNMRRLLKFQYHRARHYFERSWRLLSATDRPNMGAAEIMREVYFAVLEKIKRHDFNVFAQPTRLNKLEKAWHYMAAQRREKSLKPSPPPPPKKVLVLGAGFAGIATAVELARRGHNVTVLESRSLLGGRAQSFTDAKTGLEVDNGQHILMGCYHETLALLEALSVEHKLLEPPTLDVPYASDKGTTSLTAPRLLPGSLGLLGAMIGFGELNWADRLAAGRLTLRLRAGEMPGDDETALQWLKRCGQTDNAIRALWEPLCISAINETAAVASAKLLAVVIKQALLGSGRDARILISKVGLSSLLEVEAERLLRMCGGAQILRQQRVTGLVAGRGRIAAVALMDGRRLTADHIVSALPWNALRQILPKAAGTAESAPAQPELIPDPAAEGAPGFAAPAGAQVLDRSAFAPEAQPLADACLALGESPIVSVHLWLDRPVLDRPFMGFLDSPLHWVFSRDHIQGPTPAAPAGTGGGRSGFADKPHHVYTLVVSGADVLAQTSSAEIEEIAIRELRRFLPAAAQAQVLHRLLYKAKSATFSATPAAEKLRPNPATPWPNLWLAGDWTNTGLPATIEGAVVSGNRAAAAVDAAPVF
ncbi:squalene synthase HpnD [Verrucomicrobia bacterium LW23]|nr:squalene synthase HpnD [Verrucomicrobia bacterium LW23]